jgi:hypothetical protein
MTYRAKFNPQLLDEQIFSERFESEISCIPAQSNKGITISFLLS